MSGYLNTITPAIFVRNLRRRPDRLEHMKEQMAKIETDYLVFDNADDQGTLMTAMWWNVQNSLQLIRYAKQANLDSILLLDDDCLFVDDFNEKLAALWPYMPSDWDMISFGEIYGLAGDVYPGIVRCLQSWGGHASLVRNTMYDKLLNTLTGFDWADEEVNLKLKSSIKFYAFCPYLVTQIPGHSDLAHTYKNNEGFL